MTSGKCINTTLQALLQLSIYDLLTFFLNDKVREILRHFLVSGGGKTDNGLTTSMADIDTNEHSALLAHFFRELQFKEVTTSLTVHLL